MQCARPREVLVDDLWDDYALRLMQRDYFETPSQREPLPVDATRLAAPLSPLARSGLFLSIAKVLSPMLTVLFIVLLVFAFNAGVKDGEEWAILHSETNR